MNRKSNFLLVITFMGSLMFMGMAGLPFVLFEQSQLSPHLVAGLRLTLVGVLALAVGAVTGFKNPLKKELSRSDIKDWFAFVGLAVVGVNCTLTYALYYLDDRIAMAVMFVAIGIVFIAYYPAKLTAWVAALLAIAGTALLALYAQDTEKTELQGIVLAAIGGVSQGIIFFKKRLMPKNFDPGTALGTAFLLGGMFMITSAVFVTPVTKPLYEMPEFLIGMAISAVFTVLAWLVLGYASDKMSGAQKAGAASFEPIGAAVTQSIKLGFPVLGELLGVVLLVASALVAIWIKPKETET
ncbi:MAG: hypothetical protein ABJO52_20855 [Nisaea sp.]|uniref:hypothetical protein n=1 Tax=Nisaea sp. TaxID=2024842 RepID=UPI003297FA19